MAHTSPLRASRGWFVLSAFAGGVFAVLLWASSGGVVAGIAVATVTILVLLPAQLQAAYRLSWRLREFAGQVPGEPTAEESFLGDQSLHWPELGLTVEGGIHRFRVTGLVAEADGKRWSVQLTRPREGARRVLHDLDREPSIGAPADRLPSIYPRLSGAKAGVLVAFVVLVAVALGAPILVAGSYPLWWLGAGPLAGTAVAVVRWSGLVDVRRAVADLVDGLSAGGVHVASVDRLGGLVRLRFVVKTSEGAALLHSVAVPRAPLVVRLGDLERRASSGDATTVGRTLASVLADRTIPASTEAFVEPDPRDLTAAQRLLFVGLGAGFAGLGAVLFGGVIGAGFEVLVSGGFSAMTAIGGLSTVTGVALFAVGLHGRVPGGTEPDREP